MKDQKTWYIQAGYEYIRSFLTVAFSRFSPKSDPESFVKLAESEKAKMKSSASGVLPGLFFFHYGYIHFMMTVIMF